MFEKKINNCTTTSIYGVSSLLLKGINKNMKKKKVCESSNLTFPNAGLSNTLSSESKKNVSPVQLNGPSKVKKREDRINMNSEEGFLLNNAEEIKENSVISNNDDKPIDKLEFYEVNLDKHNVRNDNFFMENEVLKRRIKMDAEKPNSCAKNKNSNYLNFDFENSFPLNESNYMNYILQNMSNKNSLRSEEMSNFETSVNPFSNALNDNKNKKNFVDYELNLNCIFNYVESGKADQLMERGNNSNNSSSDSSSGSSNCNNNNINNIKKKNNSNNSNNNNDSTNNDSTNNDSTNNDSTNNDSTNNDSNNINNNKNVNDDNVNNNNNKKNNLTDNNNNKNSKIRSVSQASVNANANINIDIDNRVNNSATSGVNLSTETGEQSVESDVNQDGTKGNLNININKHFNSNKKSNCKRKEVLYNSNDGKEKFANFICMGINSCNSNDNANCKNAFYNANMVYFNETNSERPTFDFTFQNKKNIIEYNKSTSLDDIKESKNFDKCPSLVFPVMSTAVTNITTTTTTATTATVTTNRITNTSNRGNRNLLEVDMHFCEQTNTPFESVALQNTKENNNHLYNNNAGNANSNNTKVNANNNADCSNFANNDELCGDGTEFLVKEKNIYQLRSVPSNNFETANFAQSKSALEKITQQKIAREKITRTKNFMEHKPTQKTVEEASNFDAFKNFETKKLTERNYIAELKNNCVHLKMCEEKNSEKGFYKHSDNVNNSRNITNNKNYNSNNNSNNNKINSNEIISSSFNEVIDSDINNNISNGTKCYNASHNNLKNTYVSKSVVETTSSESFHCSKNESSKKYNSYMPNLQNANEKNSELLTNHGYSLNRSNVKNIRVNAKNSSNNINTTTNIITNSENTENDNSDGKTSKNSSPCLNKMNKNVLKEKEEEEEKEEREEAEEAEEEKEKEKEAEAEAEAEEETTNNTYVPLRRNFAMMNNPDEYKFSTQYKNGNMSVHRTESGTKVDEHKFDQDIELDDPKRTMLVLEDKFEMSGEEAIRGIEGNMFRGSDNDAKNNSSNSSVIFENGETNNGNEKNVYVCKDNGKTTDKNSYKKLKHKNDDERNRHSGNNNDDDNAETCKEDVRTSNDINRFNTSFNGSNDIPFEVHDNIGSNNKQLWYRIKKEKTNEEETECVTHNGISCLYADNVNNISIKKEVSVPDDADDVLNGHLLRRDNDGETHQHENVKEKQNGNANEDVNIIEVANGEGEVTQKRKRGRKKKEKRKIEKPLQFGVKKRGRKSKKEKMLMEMISRGEISQEDVITGKISVENILNGLDFTSYGTEHQQNKSQTQRHQQSHGSISDACKKTEEGMVESVSEKLEEPSALEGVNGRRTRRKREKSHMDNDYIYDDILWGDERRRRKRRYRKSSSEFENFTDHQKGVSFENEGENPNDSTHENHSNHDGKYLNSVNGVGEIEASITRTEFSNNSSSNEPVTEAVKKRGRGRGRKFLAMEISNNILSSYSTVMTKREVDVNKENEEAVQLDRGCNTFINSNTFGIDVNKRDKLLNFIENNLLGVTHTNFTKPLKGVDYKSKRRGRNRANARFPLKGHSMRRCEKRKGIKICTLEYYKNNKNIYNKKYDVAPWDYINFPAGEDDGMNDYLHRFLAGQTRFECSSCMCELEIRISDIGEHVDVMAKERMRQKSKEENGNKRNDEEYTEKVEENVSEACAEEEKSMSMQEMEGEGEEEEEAEKEEEEEAEKEEEEEAEKEEEEQAEQEEEQAEQEEKKEEENEEEKKEENDKSVEDKRENTPAVIEMEENPVGETDNEKKQQNKNEQEGHMMVKREQLEENKNESEELIGHQLVQHILESDNIEVTFYCLCGYFKYILVGNEWKQAINCYVEMNEEGNEEVPKPPIVYCTKCTEMLAMYRFLDKEKNKIIMSCDCGSRNYDKYKNHYWVRKGAVKQRIAPQIFCGDCKSKMWVHTWLDEIGSKVKLLCKCGFKNFTKENDKWIRSPRWKRPIPAIICNACKSRMQMSQWLNVEGTKVKMKCFCGWRTLIKEGDTWVRSEWSKRLFYLRLSKDSDNRRNKQDINNAIARHMASIENGTFNATDNAIGVGDHRGVSLETIELGENEQNNKTVDFEDLDVTDLRHYTCTDEVHEMEFFDGMVFNSFSEKEGNINGNENMLSSYRRIPKCVKQPDACINSNGERGLSEMMQHKVKKEIGVQESVQEGTAKEMQKVVKELNECKTNQSSPVLDTQKNSYNNKYDVELENERNANIFNVYYENGKWREIQFDRSNIGKVCGENNDTITPYDNMFNVKQKDVNTVVLRNQDRQNGTMDSTIPFTKDDKICNEKGEEGQNRKPSEHVDTNNMQNKNNQNETDHNKNNSNDKCSCENSTDNNAFLAESLALFGKGAIFDKYELHNMNNKEKEKVEEEKKLNTLCSSDFFNFHHNHSNSSSVRSRGNFISTENFDDTGRRSFDSNIGFVSKDSFEYRNCFGNGKNFDGEKIFSNGDDFLNENHFVSVDDFLNHSSFNNQGKDGNVINGSGKKNSGNDIDDNKKHLPTPTYDLNQKKKNRYSQNDENQNIFFSSDIYNDLINFCKSGNKNSSSSGSSTSLFDRKNVFVKNEETVPNGQENTGVFSNENIKESFLRYQHLKKNGETSDAINNVSPTNMNNQLLLEHLVQNVNEENIKRHFANQHKETEISTNKNTLASNYSNEYQGVPKEMNFLFDAEKKKEFFNYFNFSEKSQLDNSVKNLILQMLTGENEESCVFSDDREKGINYNDLPQKNEQLINFNDLSEKYLKEKEKEQFENEKTEFLKNCLKNLENNMCSQNMYFSESNKEAKKDAISNDFQMNEMKSIFENLGLKLDEDLKICLHENVKKINSLFFICLNCKELIVQNDSGYKVLSSEIFQSEIDKINMDLEQSTSRMNGQEKENVETGINTKVNVNNIGAEVNAVREEEGESEIQRQMKMYGIKILQDHIKNDDAAKVVNTIKEPFIQKRGIDFFLSSTNKEEILMDKSYFDDIFLKANGYKNDDVSNG